MLLGGNEGTAEVPDSSTEENEGRVVEGNPLLVDFMKKFQSEYYSENDTYIKENNDIFVEYHSDAQSGDALDKEFKEIGLMFANIAKENDYEPVTLTLVVDMVQAVVPRPMVDRYARGKLDEEAFKKTIGVTKIDRER